MHAFDCFMRLARKISQINEDHGFHEPMDPVLAERCTRLMLIVSELGEAVEDLRKGDMEHHAEEIADVQIRLLDYAAIEGIDLDAEVARKMEINRARPHKHGKAF